MWEPEEFFWIELENMNRSLTDDFEPLYNAAKELQVVSGNKVQGAANLLAVVANHIVSTAWERRRQEKEIALQKLLLNEEIQTRKSLEKKLNSQSLRFFLEKEKVLAGKIRLGDYVEIVEIFKVMLSDIYNDQYDTSQDSLTSIKGRVFELAVIVSRAVIELGLEPGVASESNTTFMQLLEQCTNIEEINTVAIRMLETLLEKTKNLGNSKNRLIVEGIKGYVRSNFKENLNLDMIAESVCLSPYYASRIFKESQNMTIMEYVLEVKMHEAKKLLSNPRYKIDEIARDLGYVDPSYFSKVFRRKTGLSPTQFRNHQ